MYQTNPQSEETPCIKSVGPLARLIEAMTVQELSLFLLASGTPEEKRTPQQQEIVTKIGKLVK